MGQRAIRLPGSGIYLYESKHSDGDTVDMHHHDVYQILYALDGEGRIMLQGRANEAARDHVAFLVPGTEHSVVSDTRLTLLVLAFDSECVKLLFTLDPLLESSLSRSFVHRPGTILSSEWRSLLRKLLHDQERQAQEQYGSAAGIKLTLLGILHLLARTAHAPGLADANSLRAERICKYIDTHYFQPFSVEALALKLGISSRYVNEIFKERYGVTPARYLTEVRIGLARKLLAETDKDIVSICFEVGYDTVSTFYRSFKSLVHLSPNQYRQVERERAHRSGQHPPVRS